MEPKKISFGFSKITKKSNLVFNKQSLPHKDENKIELITALEGQSIKLLNEKIKEPEKLLVIPLKESSKTSSALASLKARQAVLDGVTEENVVEQDKNVKLTIIENDSIENRAARELLEEIRNNGESDEVQNTTITVPVKTDELPLDGAAEPSLDDYDNIPITQFGFAMLRGMGWKDQPKEKNLKDLDGPIVRPKGMGLGADKITKHKPPLVPPEANEVLEIKKKAFVRILAGKNKDLYGQIEGFDDHAGRVIIKLALGGSFESLNEFMVQPVSKKEYAQYAKVINSAKYEEYKKMENKHGQIIIKKEEIKQEKEPSHYDSKENRKDPIKSEKYRNDNSEARTSRRHSEEDSRSRNHHSEDRHSKRYSNDLEEESKHRNEQSNKNEKLHDRKRREEHRRVSRSDSSSSHSSEHRSKKKSSKSKKSKNKHRHSSSEDEKRHKKKTKKSKRHRSRSRGRR